MKNSDIHNGLQDNVIRDFLAEQLIDLFYAEINVPDPRKALLNGATALERNIERYKVEIVRYQQLIKIGTQKIAIANIIEERGWKEFDVSDETIKDPENYDRLWRSFIGTQKEYNNLINKVK